MTVDDCVLCSLCNQGSALYALSGDERVAPRHAAWRLKRRRPAPVLYRFLLNGLVEVRCPLGVRLDEAVIEARRELVKQGSAPKSALVVAEKFMKGKNPYR